MLRYLEEEKMHQPAALRSMYLERRKQPKDPNPFQLL